MGSPADLEFAIFQLILKGQESLTGITAHFYRRPGSPGSRDTFSSSHLALTLLQSPSPDELDRTIEPVENEFFFP